MHTRRAAPKGTGTIETHVVALSGGKDSTAMALRLAEVEPRDYVFAITPTGDELPPMLAHWRKLEGLLGTKLTMLTSGSSLQGLIRRQNALPNWRMRWCTRMLKIEPFNAFLFANVPAVSYVGLRADEPDSVRRGTVFGKAEGVEQRFPLREWGWGLDDVWGYLESRAIEIPQRTDCSRCFYQTLGEWWELWRSYPELYSEAERDEASTGHTFRSPQRDSWPAGLEPLRLEFEKDRVPRGAKAQGTFAGMDERPSMCRVCSL